MTQETTPAEPSPEPSPERTDPTTSATSHAPAHERRHRRGLTIRLKLTLWYGGLFVLAGIILITVNFFLVHDGLTIAPEKARAVIAEHYGIPQELLEYGSVPSAFGEMPRYITVNGIPVPRLIDEAQRELKEEALRQLWAKSIMALIIMAVVTFGLAWVVAGRALRPLSTITGTARRLSDSTLHERIALKGPRDELKELADTFDAMLARLDTAFTAQKEFVANASHELRTPLTIIRTEIDVALSDPDLSLDELHEMGAAITEAVNRSEHLIDGLLVLARTESSLTFLNLDLAAITQKQVELALGNADTLNLRLELELRPAPVRGDHALVERMIGNLVENAIRHNVPEGWFAVKTFTAAGKAVLNVANSGATLSDEDVDRLLERFYRPDKSRSRKTGGFGLGLSIVKSVAAAHGGEIILRGIPSGGLDATVSLPTLLVSLPAADAVDPGTGS